MKIDNSRIYTADIYEVINSTATQSIREATKYSDTFGSYSYDDKLLQKGMVVIEFNNSAYFVPVYAIRNVIDYVIAKQNPQTYFTEDPGFLPKDGKRYLKNKKLLFNSPGMTTLAELQGIQKLQHDKDDTILEMEG